MDAGRVTGFATGGSIQAGNVNTTVTAPDVVNCLPYHKLFLRSSLGNGYDAIGPALLGPKGKGQTRLSNIFPNSDLTTRPRVRACDRTETISGLVSLPPLLLIAVYGAVSTLLLRSFS